MIPTRWPPGTLFRARESLCRISRAGLGATSVQAAASRCLPTTSTTAPRSAPPSCRSTPAATRSARGPTNSRRRSTTAPSPGARDGPGTPTGDPLNGSSPSTVCTSPARPSKPFLMYVEPVASQIRVPRWQADHRRNARNTRFRPSSSTPPSTRTRTRSAARSRSAHRSAPHAAALAALPSASLSPPSPA
jgi:hypothetical protein